MDPGEPISYKLLRRGTRVESADGEELGTVKRVLEIQREHLFDGIVIRTAAGDRFVDAPEVAAIYEQLVVLTIDASDASRLPKPGETGSMGLRAQGAEEPGPGEAVRRRGKALGRALKRVSRRRR